MKINLKLIVNFGTVIITTLVVFGLISYYTFAESTYRNSDKIIVLQSGEIIYQVTKRFNKTINSFEQQLSLFMQSNACSLNSEAETKGLFAEFARHNPPFRAITLYYARGSVPAEFRTWLDEIEDNSFEPFFRRQSGDLFLLWPTQTPQGRAFFVINIDQAQLASTMRPYLSISGAAVMLTDQDQTLLSPIQQDQLHPLATTILDHIKPQRLSTDRIEKNGPVYTYRPPDTLFGAELTLVVPREFYQTNLIFFKNRIIAAMLIVGWVSIWTLLIVAYRISRPIRKLSQITKDIIAFNYSTELEIPPSNDEIGELAQNFENMRQKIKDLVVMDPLTQVYNRRFMRHIFELAVLKALRQENNLCCLMMDIDHFKHVNDTYGHQGGDAVLMAIGKALREVSRAYDTPARYGGEEFILILPETRLTDAIAIAERIRAKIGQLVTVFEGAEIGCTMSLGVAALDTCAANTMDKIIHNADRALYRAKENGRDQVAVYEKA